MSRAPLPTTPLVSVVIPCRNEEAHVGRCLTAFLDQDYPSKLLELLVVDGRSEDRTRDVVAALAAQHPSATIHVIDNPEIQIARGMNRGVERARGDVILIFGAHSYPSASYVRFIVESLQATGAIAAGGRRIETGDTTVTKLFAAARATIIGGAFSTYRRSQTPRFVSTVPYAGYRREAFDQCGLFNAAAPPVEDLEFNLRLQAAGFSLYFDPRIVGYYRNRRTSAQFARQLFRYAYHRPLVTRHYNVDSRAQLMVPAAFVAFLVAYPLVAVAFPKAFAVSTALLGAYIALVLVCSLLAARPLGIKQAPAIAAAIGLIHIAVGIGSIAGIRNWFKRLPPPPTTSVNSVLSEASVE